MPRLTRKRYWIPALLVLIALAIRLWAPGWINQAYAHAARQAPVLFEGCQKAWAHRGFVGEGQEDSIGSVQRAIARGASGVEIDVLYDADSGQFMVSHDRPYQTTNGQTLTLDQMLEAIGPQVYFWLDAKDLSGLWPWQANDAVNRLATVLARHGMTDRALVESRNPIYLGWLAERGVHTSYMISPNEAGYSAPIFWGNVYVMKLAYTFGPFSALSMNDDRYTRTVQQAFGDEVPILVSTVNDRDAFELYAENPRIAVVLTDRDYYAYNSCATERTTDAPVVD